MAGAAAAPSPPLLIGHDPSSEPTTLCLAQGYSRRRWAKDDGRGNFDWICPITGRLAYPHLTAPQLPGQLAMPRDGADWRVKMWAVISLVVIDEMAVEIITQEDFRWRLRLMRASFTEFSRRPAPMMIMMYDEYEHEHGPRALWEHNALPFCATASPHGSDRQWLS